MLLEGYEVLIPIKHEYSIGEGKIVAVCTLPSMDLYQTIARTADVVNRILIVGRLLSENKGESGVIATSRMKSIIICRSM